MDAAHSQRGLCPRAHGRQILGSSEAPGIDARHVTDVVALGRFRDERSEIALAKFLIERREAILRKYLVAINPIVDPVLHASGELRFSNAAVDAGVADPPTGGYAPNGSISTTRQVPRPRSARLRQLTRKSTHRPACYRPQART
jgi:hypothetical protein